MICDGSPVACIGREIINDETFPYWSKRCPGCYENCRDEAISFGLKTQKIGQLASADTLSKLREISQSIDIADITSYSYRGINVGTHTLSSAIRYYKGKITEIENNILREFFFSSMVIAEAAINKIETFQPAVILMSHGAYSTWGPALEAAMIRDVPIVKFGGAYRKQCMYYHKVKSNMTNFHFGYLSDAEWEKRLKTPFTSKEEKRLKKYLEERYVSGMHNFKDIKMSQTSEGKQALFNKLTLTDCKPVWCVFTPIGWDSSANLAQMAFRDFYEWTIETVKIISDIDSVQWLIKTHPAERMYATVDGIGELIRVNFPDLPANIKVIPSDTDINTYNLMRVITGGITCYGTVGLELATLGKPAIVAGDAYYSRRGFTYDALTVDEYKDLLKNVNNIPPSITMEQREKAIKFAYSYYIQRQLPLRMFIRDSDGNALCFDWDKIDSLIPGKDPVIDLICNRFFEGDDFILSDEGIREVVDKL